MLEALSLFSFAVTRKASKSAYSTKVTGSVFAIALNFLIFFSGTFDDGFSNFCSGWMEQFGRLAVSSRAARSSRDSMNTRACSLDI